MNINWRAYFFGSMYLSSIQQGIQAAHVLTKMFRKYSMEDDTPLRSWADHHLTIILLNGGSLPQLLETKELMENKYNFYPWDYFIDPYVGNGITSLGIILPEDVYDMDFDPNSKQNFTEDRDIQSRDDWDLLFKMHMSRRPLAR